MRMYMKAILACGRVFAKTLRSTTAISCKLRNTNLTMLNVDSDFYFNYVTTDG